MPSYVVNPHSGRKIVVGGAVYKKIFGEKKPTKAQLRAGAKKPAAKSAGPKRIKPKVSWKPSELICKPNGGRRAGTLSCRPAPQTSPFFYTKIQDRGMLGRYGYKDTKKMTVKQRHDILETAVKDLAKRRRSNEKNIAAEVGKRLAKVAILRKNKDKTSFDRFMDDARWVTKRFNVPLLA